MSKFNFRNCSLLNKVLEFLKFLARIILVSYKPVLLGLECMIVYQYKCVTILIGDRIRVRFLCLQNILEDFVF